MKFCKDCKYYKLEIVQAHDAVYSSICKHPDTLKFDVVTGDNIPYIAYLAREAYSLCGPFGKNFRAKDEVL